MGAIYEVDKASGGSVTRTVTYYPVAGAMRINNTLYYILKDHLGSASVVTDANGVEVGEQRYYPFGETRLTTGTIYTDKLFTGQREMAGLGIYHYQARFYSPKLGRFLSADTIVPSYANPQSLNRYSYVLGNPLKYIDPTGHSEDCGIGMGCVSPHIPISSTPAPSPNGGGRGEDDDEPDPSDGEPIELNLNEQQTLSVPYLYPNLLFNPIPNERVIFCQTHHCDIRVFNIPGEYHIDWSRVDKAALTLDVIGLALSLAGLGSVSNALRINSRLERGTLQTLNIVVTTGSVGRGIESNDGMGLYLTGMGILFPPLSIPTSAGAVLNDLSSAIYFVPSPIYGPPLPPN